MGTLWVSLPQKKEDDIIKNIRNFLKIHRDKNQNGSLHNGIIEFENGLKIPFQVTDSELKEIHYEQLLKDRQTKSGVNIYQATFELTNE